MKEISREELKARLDEGAEVTVIDVLGPEAFAEYHIAGAVNVPFGHEFIERVQKAAPDKARTVVLYCTNVECGASAKAARIMEERLGYADVRHFPGGKEAWREAGLPLESGSEHIESMPEIAMCSMEECAYNEKRHCHALAITVGGPHPRCDTFLRSIDKGGSANGSGRVGACKVVNCVHNRALECSADAITVSPHETHPDCATFAPRLSGTD